MAEMIRDQLVVHQARSGSRKIAWHDHDNCLEVLVARGKSAGVKKMADQLIAAKGVKHGHLTITTTGKDLPL